ncbi:MAG: helix-turn-helix domain-containing protein [Terriglobales bacterium]
MNQLDPVLVPILLAAELLGVSVRTVQNLIAAKELPSRKIGRRRLIPYSALQALARRDSQTESGQKSA